MSLSGVGVRGRSEGTKPFLIPKAVGKEGTKPILILKVVGNEERSQFSK
jgi:hypothetical protein